MNKKVAVFGKMGVKFAPIIEKNFADKYDDWQVTSWPCDDDTAARDAILADCEAAVMSADFILTPGNFGALMAAPNLKILLQPWVGTDWLDAGFLPKGLRFCNAGGHAAPMAEYVLGTMLEHALELRQIHQNMLDGNWTRSGRNASPEARHGDLSGKHVGIVGYGEIAQAVAARAHAFGMSVSAVARSKRDASSRPGRPDSWFRWSGFNWQFSLCFTMMVVIGEIILIVKTVGLESAFAHKGKLELTLLCIPLGLISCFK